MGDHHEHCNAHHIVDHRADDDGGDEGTLEGVTVLHAEADDVGHQGERDEEAAGGADELIETAGEVCQHRHAHSAQCQVHQRSDGGKLGTQHHSSQRDGEGLHGHGDAQRHRDGDLGHDGDDGGEQTCIADVPHRELGLGGRSGLGVLTHKNCSSYTFWPKAAILPVWQTANAASTLNLRWGLQFETKNKTEKYTKDVAFGCEMCYTKS